MKRLRPTSRQGFSQNRRPCPRSRLPALTAGATVICPALSIQCRPRSSNSRARPESRLRISSSCAVEKPLRPARRRIAASEPRCSARDICLKRARATTNPPGPPPSASSSCARLESSSTKDSRLRAKARPAPGRLLSKAGSQSRRSQLRSGFRSRLLGSSHH